MSSNECSLCFCKTCTLVLRLIHSWIPKKIQIKYEMHEVTEHSNSVRVARDLINWQVKKERNTEIGYKDPRTN